MMYDVRKIMTAELVSITPENSVRKAIELMDNYKIGCLPVLYNKKLVGLITSRDINRSHPNRLVADAMSRNIVTITADCSPWDAKKIMDQYEIERLPVVDHDSLVGLVTKAQLYAELGKYVDALTGLNKAEMFRHKALELLKIDREICIIFFDLDHFGVINKEFGHVTGNEILCGVAQIFVGLIDPDTDYLCRYGGDEFAIVSTKNIDEAQKFIAHIFDAFEARKWPYGIKITVSAGISGGRRSSSRRGNLTRVVDDLINQASLASTKAKNRSYALVIANSCG